MFLFYSISALALSLNLESETTPYPGVLIQQYRASSPSTDVSVVTIDLCASGIHVDATKQSDSYQTVSSWANMKDVQVAINGDFFRTAPVRVYGDAIGNGIPWPMINTGRHPDYTNEWYFQHYGWVAFGHDRVWYTHTEWVKNNASQFGGSLKGWEPTLVAPDPPPGVIALVSGFPELVIEGQVYSCSSPTASDCFPDRTDMRTRHPRSAIGLSEDMQTLYLVAVDGRTPSNSGMYGAELADLMGQLGIWFALNVDGGGSSQLWSDGYVNSPTESRLLANHLGVFAGGVTDMPTRPGHCFSEPVCQSLPPGGGIIDDSSDCFQLFGDAQYWRTEGVGHDGGLHWTNAFTSTEPINWAWWRIHVEEAGDYELEYYAEPQYSVFDSTAYVLLANGNRTDLTVDQSSASGWTSLGVYEFNGDADQYLAIYDNGTGWIPSNQHIVADAIRLTRVGPYCGDGVCDGVENCSVCPEDCEPAALDEPGNGIDDDCDGFVDGDAICEAVSGDGRWCLDNDTLAICDSGYLSEVECLQPDQICSSDSLQCIDTACFGRENSSWCDASLLQTCEDGLLTVTDCTQDGGSCADDTCILADPEDSGEDSLSSETDDAPKAGCAQIANPRYLTFSALLLAIVLGWRRESAKKRL